MTAPSPAPTAATLTAPVVARTLTAQVTATPATPAQAVVTQALLAQTPLAQTPLAQTPLAQIPLARAVLARAVSVGSRDRPPTIQSGEARLALVPTVLISAAARTARVLGRMAVSAMDGGVWSRPTTSRPMCSTCMTMTGRV
jgi:hypothetical protein